MTLKALIADDHPLVREGTLNILQRINSDHEIFQATNFTEAKLIIEQQTELDLIILDLYMPQMNGTESILQLRQQHPCTPVVIISASENIEDIRGAINNGANGYITKSSSNEVILNALRLILSGGLYLPPQWTISSPAKDKTLTIRQKEVITLLATGKANKEIAREFSISDKTVKAHLSEIFKRLQVSNRTQAVHQARKLGYLNSEI